jgi:V/A-type H+/Na+-transporting ATPase subunit E
MTGLDKIIGKINADSESECNAIIENAKTKCDKIIAEGEKNGKALADKIIADAKAQADKTIAIAKSGAAQQTRQSLLAAKVDVINETLDKVAQSLKTLPADLYFKAVIKLAADNAIKGDCSVKLNSEDHLRLPADFEEKISDALKSKGANCKLSSEPANINSGVVLDYGEIVVNCSFEAVIEENAEEYKEKISKILF